jgi:hypothetical protein
VSRNYQQFRIPEGQKARQKYKEGGARVQFPLCCPSPLTFRNGFHFIFDNPFLDEAYFFLLISFDQTFLSQVIFKNKFAFLLDAPTCWGEKCPNKFGRPDT